MKSTVCQSRSEVATKLLGNTLAANLDMGGTLLLYGDLGAGKTTFVQGLAEGLGIEQKVTSPTFNLLSMYPATHPVIKQLVHIDLYRLNTGDALEHLDLATHQANPANLVVVEWPGRSFESWTNILGELHFVAKGFHHRSITANGQVASLLS